MGADQLIDWNIAAASVLDWWHDAGVDVLVDDSPRDWLAAVEIPAPQERTVGAPRRAAPAPAPATAAAPTVLPATLVDFLAWRTGADAPESGWSGPAISASGPAQAAVMVLVDCPERDDSDMLMGGAEGRLFDRMLAAIGLARADVHLAAVCARRPVAGRVAQEAEARLAEITRHHVGLVAPRRLLLMGNAASRAILGMDANAARERLHEFNHKTGKTGVVASFHPRFLIERPAMKAQAWKDLQMLMGNRMAGSGAA